MRASYCNIFDPKNSEEIRLFEEILVTVKRGEESGTDAAVEFTYLIFYAANALTMSMLLHCTHTLVPWLAAAAHVALGAATAKDVEELIVLALLPYCTVLKWVSQ